MKKGGRESECGGEEGDDGRAQGLGPANCGVVDWRRDKEGGAAAWVRRPRVGGDDKRLFFQILVADFLFFPRENDSFHRK